MLLSYDEAKKIALSKNVDDRRSLAARHDLSPEILFFLANDPDDVVRERVAANIHTPWPADEILAKDEKDLVRNALADKIIYKLEKNDDYVNPESPFHRFWGRLVGICHTLVSDSADYIRRKISTMVVSKGFFPKDLVERLVKHPDRQIAIYAIEHSKDLSVDELLTLLKNGSADVAAAISRRPSIANDVIQHIIKNGNPIALKELVKNEHLTFSDETVETMSSHLKEHPELEADLLNANNLSLEAIKKISLIVSESALSELLRRQQLTPQDMEEVMQVMRKRVHSNHMDHLITDIVNREVYHDHKKALTEEEEAYSDFIKGYVQEDRLYDDMKENRLNYLLTILSLRANLPFNVIRKAFEFKNGKAIVSITWRAGFSMRFALELQKNMARMTNYIIYPRNGDQYPFDPKEMNWQIDFFVNLCKN